MRYMQRLGLSAAACCVFWLGGAAQATVINFEDVVGPSTFAAAGPAVDYSITIGGYFVVVHGGHVLTMTTFLPANQTSIYGTASFGGPSYADPLTVSFFDALTHAPKTIANFFLDVLNGEPFTVAYTVADNIGNSATFALPPNLSSGAATIGFAAAGSVVTIFGAPASGAWDFFIDNIHFNEQLPGRVPEPGSLALLGLAVTALAIRRRLDRRN